MKLTAMEYSIGTKIHREWFTSKYHAERRRTAIKADNRTARGFLIGTVRFGVTRLGLTRFLTELEKFTPFVVDDPIFEEYRAEHESAPSHESGSPLEQSGS